MQKSWRMQGCRDARQLSIHSIKPSFSLFFICLLQPHTPKSRFCADWRKATTRFRCSSPTQGCPLCSTTQRSKFRCVSVRTGCCAALPTLTAPAFWCCSRRSCLPCSVSTIIPTNHNNRELALMISLLVSLCYKRINDEVCWSLFLFFEESIKGQIVNCTDFYDKYISNRSSCLY